MKRPYALRFRSSGRVLATASTFERLLNSNMMAVLAYSPTVALRVDWIEPDGTAYPLDRIIETTRTVAQIYEISRQYLDFAEPAGPVH